MPVDDDELIEDLGEPPLSPGLRCTGVLRTPRRLASTPTETHIPGRPRESGEKTSVQRACPHCKNKVNVKLETGRATKSTPRNGRKEVRYVVIEGYDGNRQRGPLYRVEDQSPTMRRRPGRGKKAVK